MSATPKIERRRNSLGIIDGPVSGRIRATTLPENDRAVKPCQIAARVSRDTGSSCGHTRLLFAQSHRLKSYSSRTNRSLIIVN